MKPTARILLTLPLLITTLLYYKFHDPDEECFGLVHLAMNFIFYFFFLLSGFVALYGIFRKRSLQTKSVEPISSSFIVLSILILVYNSTQRGHTKGEKWIYAESNDSQLYPKASLVLRKNGNFTMADNYDDFGCSISGIYKRKGDTVFLSDDVVPKTNETITTIYLINSNKLMPLFDTINKSTFYITNMK